VCMCGCVRERVREHLSGVVLVCATRAYVRCSACILVVYATRACVRDTVRVQLYLSMGVFACEQLYLIIVVLVCEPQDGSARCCRSLQMSTTA
jgi:hypothetical protein